MKHGIFKVAHKFLNRIRILIALVVAFFIELSSIAVADSASCNPSSPTCPVFSLSDGNISLTSNEIVAGYRIPINTDIVEDVSKKIQLSILFGKFKLLRVLIS